MRGYLFTYFNMLKRLYRNCVSENKFPMLLIIFITSQCTNNCVHCWRPDNSKNTDYIDIETIKNIRNEHIPIILLSGGEPTEHPNLKEIVQYLTNGSTKVIILSNGLNARRLLESIVNKNRNRVILSFNPYDTEANINEKYKTIKLLKENQILVYVNIIIDTQGDNDKLLNIISPISECISRIYVTKYITHDCRLVPDDFGILYKYSKFLADRFKISVITAKPYGYHMGSIYRFLSRLMELEFDECSGYPFRASMNEKGIITNCIRSAHRKVMVTVEGKNKEND